MPKSFLKSQDPPNVPVENWLTWSASTLETSIADPSNKIAGVMGIDIAHLIMPTIVTNALGESSVILGNNFDASNKPSHVFIDTSDFGFITVIKKYSDIPNKIHPEEPLPSKFFRGTTWESATAELGLTRFPLVVPILFGMSAVEASVHDDDFKEKLGTMSPKHTIWAKLIKEHFVQNENNEKCVDKFFDRVYKQGGRDKINAKYVADCCLDGKIFDYSFIQAFTLPSSKWKESQSSLCSFFKSNLSPVWLSQNTVTTSSSPIIPPAGVHFAATTTNQQAAATTSPPQANTATTFDPMAFMKQFADQMMAVQ
jgi:hypothetical protein